MAPKESPSKGADAAVPAVAVVAPDVSSLVDWRDEARCLTTDPDIFFPKRSGRLDGAAMRTAKAWCRDCPVRLPCLQTALLAGENFGVWGGLSASERRRLAVRS